MKQFNVLVYGTGAVGIYFGGKLHQAGFKVVFVDTPEKTEKIHETGLHIQSNIDGNYDFEPEIVDDISGLPPQDIIMVCVKAYQTYDIAINLVPVVKPSTIVLSLQNGLENEKVLSDILGKNLIMGSVIYYNGMLSEISTVVQMAPAKIIFGEMDHQPSERGEWLSDVLSRADIAHEISSEINQEIWKKFIWNNAFNSISAITKTTLAQIYEFSEIFQTIGLMMKEVQQIAIAEGIEISDQSVEELLKTDTRHGDVKPSMLKDIELEQLPELDPLIGVVLRKGKKLGISTPVNQTIYQLIQLAIKNSIDLDPD